MQKEAKSSKNNMFMFYANPMIRKIARIEEKSDDCACERVCEWQSESG